MSCVYLQTKTYDFNFPCSHEPSWGHLVDRWYQLDAAAYGLSQAYSVWASEVLDRPRMIILASPLGSTETDFRFVQAGAMSPSKFVHTLPNSRGGPLLQLMNWSGPLLCLQSDPFTQVSAVNEAADFARQGRGEVWVFGVQKRAEASYQSRLYRLSEKMIEPAQTLLTLSPAHIREPMPSDADLCQWLDQSGDKEPFCLPDRYMLSKRTPQS